MLLWCDGFDHYGDGSTGDGNMTDGAWAEASGASAGRGPSTAIKRTGTHSYLLGQGTSPLIRRTFGADKEVVGLGYALYLSALPINNNVLNLAQLRDSANAAQLSFVLTTVGEIQCKRGNHAGTVLATSAQVIVAESFQHVEFRARIHDTLGEAEVRVNGVTVLTVSGVDTKNTAIAGAAQFVFSKSGAAVDGNNYYMDDLFAWDDSGDYNNDFIGDRRVATLFPISDFSPTDWVRNTGSNDFAAIDDTAPDDDTTYIAAGAPTGSPPVNPTSDFQKTALPANIAGISAVYVVSRMRKTDAGGCNVQMSMVSSEVGSPPAAAVGSGTDRPITEAYTYYGDAIEVDPATGAPWTPAALDDALFRLERTA